MAIIGAIHNRGKYVLVGLMALALVIFILSAFFDTLGAGPSRGTQGRIDGEPIDDKKYAELYENARMQEIQQIQQREGQGRELNDQERVQVENRAWQMLVDEQILGMEFEKLGLEVSDEEYKSYLFGKDGFSLMSDIEQNFKNQATGKFDEAALEKFLKEKRAAKTPEEKKQWETTEKALRDQRKNEKYFQILNQGLYVTKLEAKEEYLAKNESKSVSYVVKSFRDMEDKKVKVTDAEVKAYYEEHKNEAKYKTTAGRDVQYFDISIQPSKKDSNEMNAEMLKLKAGYAGKTGIEDSTYVVNNSELKFWNSKLVFRMAGDPKAQGSLTYPAQMDTVFKSAAVGSIVGPYFDQGKVRLTKVLGFNTKLCTSRHILLSVPKGDAVKDAAQKKLADSLVKVINKDNFGDFVMKYSEDPGSKDKGGKYEDFLPTDMVPEFGNYCANEPIGKIGYVKTDFGYHIIENIERKETKMPLVSFIEKTLKPSTETAMNLSDEATDVLLKLESKMSKQSELIKKIALFDTIARQEGYFSRAVQLREEAPSVQGFQTEAAANKILQLAYGEDAEVGRLIGAPILDKERYVIAMVKSIREEDGVQSYEDAYVAMKQAVMNQKKAKIFSSTMKGTNLEAIAKKNGTTVQSTEMTFSNSTIGEYKLIGSIFGSLKDGKVSVPLVGDNGVYVFKVIRTKKAGFAKSYDAEKDAMLGTMKQGLMQYTRMALMKKLNVQDNRALLKAGIMR